jgi:hypothetical protein
LTKGDWRKGCSKKETEQGLVIENHVVVDVLVVGGAMDHHASTTTRYCYSSPKQQRQRQRICLYQQTSQKALLANAI